MKKYSKEMIIGAKIILKDWIELKEGENLLIVIDQEGIDEGELLLQEAEKIGGIGKVEVMDSSNKQAGEVYDENEKAFDGYDVIIGAASYSLITVNATKYAVSRGSRFLSLPLNVNDDRSMLEYDFIRMDPKVSKMMASFIQDTIDKGKKIEIKSKSGTNLTVYKENRKTGLFNGNLKDGEGISSASFEIYVPIEETKTQGTLIVDGSLGYIGAPKENVKIEIKDGEIEYIQDNESGRKLKKYFKEFKDEEMCTTSEFGIGLNLLSQTVGNSYIEDESAYKIFHIGFGRNTALGGTHDATGHFDLVGMYPDIYVDGKMIIKEGNILFE